MNQQSKAKVEDFSDELLHEFAYSALGNLCPIQAFIGGVAAQEVMKASVTLLIIVDECLHACLPACLFHKVVSSSCLFSNSNHDQNVFQRMESIVMFIVSYCICVFLRNTSDLHKGVVFVRDSWSVANSFRLCCTENWTLDSNGRSSITDCAVNDFPTDTHGPAINHPLRHVAQSVGAIVSAWAIVQVTARG